MRPAASWALLGRSKVSEPRSAACSWRLRQSSSQVPSAPASLPPTTVQVTDTGSMAVTGLTIRSPTAGGPVYADFGKYHFRRLRRATPADGASSVVPPGRHHASATEAPGDWYTPSAVWARYVTVTRSGISRA